MTPYTITLNSTTTEQAGAALAQAVSKAPHVTCPECGASVRTYNASGATLIEYHRAGANWTWCNGSDYNMSEATE